MEVIITNQIAPRLKEKEENTEGMPSPKAKEEKVPQKAATHAEETIIKAIAPREEPKEEKLGPKDGESLKAKEQYNT